MKLCGVGSPAYENTGYYFFVGRAPLPDFKSLFSPSSHKNKKTTNLKNKLVAKKKNELPWPLFRIFSAE